MNGGETYKFQKPIFSNKSEENSKIYATDPSNTFFDSVSYSGFFKRVTNSPKYNDKFSTSSITVEPGNDTYVTIKGDSSVTYSLYYVTATLSHSKADDPALTYISIEPGKSVEFSCDDTSDTSNELVNASYWDGNKDLKYDYASYKNSEVIDINGYGSNTNDGSIDLLYEQKTCVITARAENTAPIIFYYPSKIGEHNSTDEPALDYITLKPNESCSVSSLQDKYLSLRTTNSDLKYDYASYCDTCNCATPYVDFKKDSSGSLSLKPSNRSYITASKQNSENLIMYAPKRAFSFATNSLPALSYIKCNPGETVKVYCPNIKLRGLYLKSQERITAGITLYDENDEMVKGSTGTDHYISIPKSGKAVITSPNYSEFYYPYGIYGQVHSSDTLELPLDLYIVGQDMYEGTSITFSISYPKLGLKVTSTKWAIDDDGKKIASVNDNGVVTAKCPGKASISATVEFTDDKGNIQTKTASKMITVIASDFLDQYTFSIRNTDNVFKNGWSTFSWNTFGSKHIFDKAAFTEKFIKCEETDELYDRYKKIKGRCFGMAAMSMLFAAGDEDIRLYQNSKKGDVSKVSQLKRTATRISDGKSLKHVVETAHALQHTEKLLNDTLRLPDSDEYGYNISVRLNDNSFDAAAFISAMQNELTKSNSVLLDLHLQHVKKNILGQVKKDEDGNVIYGDPMDHAVLLYDISVLKDKYILYIYDPNFPLKSSRIEFTRENGTSTVTAYKIYYIDSDGEYCPTYADYTCDFMFTIIPHTYQKVKEVYSTNENEPSGYGLSTNCAFPVGTVITDSDGNSVAVEDIPTESNGSRTASMIRHNTNTVTADGIQVPEYYFVSMPQGSYTAASPENSFLDIILNDGENDINICATSGSKAAFSITNSGNSEIDGSIKVSAANGSNGEFSISTRGDTLYNNGIDVLNADGVFENEFTFNSKTNTYNNVKNVSVNLSTSEQTTFADTDVDVNYENLSLNVNSGSITASDNGTELLSLEIPSRIKLDTPVSSVKSGNKNEAISITLSNELGGDIRYTTDGTEPTEYSQLFCGDISISKNTTLKAAAFKDGYVTSDVLTCEYTFSSVTAPYTTLTEKILTEEKMCELLCDIEDAKVYYTTDGKDPIVYGNLYTSPITVNSDMTIKAVTCKNGIYSDIFEISYIFNPTGFTLLNAVTDQNGNIVTKSNFSDVSSLSLTLYAPDFVGKSENMYICEYNRGKLVSVAKKEFTQSEETTTVNFPWTASGNEVSALKAFIWDANSTPHSDDILIFQE